MANSNTKPPFIELSASRAWKKISFTNDENEEVDNCALQTAMACKSIFNAFGNAKTPWKLVILEKTRRLRFEVTTNEEIDLSKVSATIRKISIKHKNIMVDDMQFLFSSGSGQGQQIFVFFRRKSSRTLQSFFSLHGQTRSFICHNTTNKLSEEIKQIVTELHQEFTRLFSLMDDQTHVLMHDENYVKLVLKNACIISYRFLTDHLLTGRVLSYLSKVTILTPQVEIKLSVNELPHSTNFWKIVLSSEWANYVEKPPLVIETQSKKRRAEESLSIIVMD